MAFITDDHERGRFRVSRDVFTDPEVFKLEQERVFARCWLYIGHASEVAKPSSYIAREVAGKPMIMTRDKTGAINVFYNACTHRGTMICRERSGSGPTFLCPYHAWSFDLQGKLVKIPGPEAMAPSSNEDGSLNLRRVERLEEFKGFVFICSARRRIISPMSPIRVPTAWRSSAARRNMRRRQTGSFCRRTASTAITARRPM